MGSYRDYRTKPNADEATLQLDRRERTLSDSLLAVFHQACDKLELDVALHLLVILEERINFEMDAEYIESATPQGLAIAHARLKQLRNSSRRFD
jgi:hypothetical protein